jgi:RimJ/RimL family protein N-acetyltransferase
VSDPLQGEGFALRRASERDLDFMVALTGHEEVEPFMAAVSARKPAEILDEIRRSETDPQHYGRFVIEVDGVRSGLMSFEVFSRRSRIADLRGLMLHPDFRGRGLADAAARLLIRHLVYDLGYHRVQLECYGFNERAIRHAVRAGFTQEGIKRQAYWRHGEWVDGVLFGLVREDLEAAS